MPDPLLDERSIHADTPDADIVRELKGNPLGEHAASFQAEMSSRLRRALIAFSESADRSAGASLLWARRLYWATWTLFVMTAALVILTAVLIVR